MLKKFAAIGVSAAIAFAPLAALAQTDQAAPGAAPASATDQGAMAPKPMKKKPHHMSSSKMKKPMEKPMAAPAAAANSQ